MLASDIPLLLQAIHDRYPAIRGRRVDYISLEIASNGDGGGTLMAVFPILGETPNTRAKAIITMDVQADADLKSIDDLAALASGEREVNWLLDDEG